jgi:hypothetical protein
LRLPLSFTVARNGVKIIDQIEIPGITGGALDSHAAAPGPLLLQGDHPGGIRFRNITVAVPKSVPKPPAARKKS